MDLFTLDSAIIATRTARDNSARAAQKARTVGIPTMGDELDLLAASYDRLLANLLYLKRDLQEMDEKMQRGY